VGEALFLNSSIGSAGAGVDVRLDIKSGQQGSISRMESAAEGAAVRQDSSNESGWPPRQQYWDIRIGKCHHYQQ